MSHQPGWIELYELLENQIQPPIHLVEKCKSSRTGLDETMLHWYAIEGSPEVLATLIELGFEIDVQNCFGSTPLMECSMIERWDNAKILLENGADIQIRNKEGLSYLEYLSEFEVVVPEWIHAYT